MAFTRRYSRILAAICAVLCPFAAIGVSATQTTSVGSGNSDEGVNGASSQPYPLDHFLHRVNSNGQALIVAEKRVLVSTPGHTVIELHFSANDGLHPDSPPGAASDAKSILLEVGPGIFREIYFLNVDLGTYTQPLSWATVLDLDRERILATNDRVEGNGGYCSDGYWRLNGAGAQIVDFSQVDKALSSRAPKGSSIVESRCWALDMTTETIYTFAKKPDTCHTCDYTAHVTVHFHFNGSVAIPDRIEAEPMDSDN